MDTSVPSGGQEAVKVWGPPKKERKIRQRHVRVGVGLPRREAVRRASRRSPGDFRGAKYDAKKGTVSLR